MSNSCLEALNQHASLAERQRRSAERLETVRGEFARSKFLDGLPLSIFCAGSLARLESGTHSDMDIFVLAERSPELRSRLCEYKLFAEAIRINGEALGFPEFSNDGQYLKICFTDDLTKRTGSPQDDMENLFTTRMLLLLESTHVLHADAYQRHLDDICKHYYRDDRGKRTFRPLFLINDLLRYWRTLCLNYEERRNDVSKPWRKKNVNLKFSRMVTVFGSVLPITLGMADSADALASLCGQAPLQRLASALDVIADDGLSSRWPGILDGYEQFLKWKEQDDVEAFLREGPSKQLVRAGAEQLSEFLHDALTHPTIKPELRRYLVL